MSVVPLHEQPALFEIPGWSVSGHAYDLSGKKLYSPAPLTEGQHVRGTFGGKVDGLKLERQKDGSYYAVFKIKVLDCHLETLG
jgi:hypothetical protein